MMLTRFSQLSNGSSRQGGLGHIRHFDVMRPCEHTTNKGADIRTERSLIIMRDGSKASSSTQSE